MQNFTFKKLLSYLLSFTEEQLLQPVRIIALNDCEVNPIFRFNGGLITNKLSIKIPEHNIYNVRTPHVYGTSSLPLDELIKDNASEVSLTLIAKAGMPFLCVHSPLE